jgi:hypothetical protein
VSVAPYTRYKDAVQTAFVLNHGRQPAQENDRDKKQL